MPEYWLDRLLFGYRLAPSLLAILLLLNLVTMWMVVHRNKESRAEYRQDCIEAVASEWSLPDEPLILESDSK